MAENETIPARLNERAVLTVLGSDRSGIVAAVTGVLAQHNANILDISQTILQGIFTMTMLVDLGESDVEFLVLHDELDALSEELQVQIALQREEVFKFMYRL
jgi:ACT domain-containing protein